MIPSAAFVSPGGPSRLLRSVHPALKLGAALLGVITCLLASPVVLVGSGLLLGGLLIASGLSLSAQLRSLRPWLPMALVILVLHVFTTTAAAPLGRPSLGGAIAGLRALLRVLCTVGWLALLMRTISLNELIAAVRWYLRPAERWGFPGQDLGLVLAVAMGTAPLVLGEGRRIETVVRLRRQGASRSRPKGPARWLAGQLDRARVIVPLVESLGRRADTLSLSLRSRRPDSVASLLPSPPLPGLLGLAVWAAGLVWAFLHQGGVA